MRLCPTIKRFAPGALLIVAFVLETLGQSPDASNARKAHRLKAYEGTVLVEDYVDLLGIYQRRDASAVEAFLRSLGIHYRLLSDRAVQQLLPSFRESDATRPQNTGPQSTKGTTPDQGMFIVDLDPKPDPFLAQRAVEKIATNPLVDDFLLDPGAHPASLPFISTGYCFDQSVFCDDPAHPDPQQVLSRLTALFQRFFSQFKGASWTLAASDSGDFSFTLRVTGLHSAVLPDVRDAERLDADVTLAPQLGRNTVFLKVAFNGQYAPMPDKRPPADGRYEDFEHAHHDAAEKFAQRLSAFLQSQYHATAR